MQVKLSLSISVCLLGISLGGVWFATRNQKVDFASGPAHQKGKGQLRLVTETQVPELGLLKDTGLHWEERIKAVRSLPSVLDVTVLEGLFSFLQVAPDGPRGDWYLVCNEIMEVLRKGNHMPGLYTTKSLSLIQSPSVDPVIRDYAAQHLVQWISGIDPTSCEKDHSQVSDAFHALCLEVSAPTNGQLTLAGTILNGLVDAVINGSSVMQEKEAIVGDLALKVIDSPEGQFSNANRAAAIQVAARLQVEELRERCRGLATNPRAAVDLRLSAIAALGIVGEMNDYTLLESFTSDQSFKFAAAAAINRVEQRFSRQ